MSHHEDRKLTFEVMPTETLPLSLRTIAYIYIFVGSIFSVEVLIQSYVDHVEGIFRLSGLLVTISFVLLGMGILGRRMWAFVTAKIFAYWMIFGAGFAAVLLLLLNISPSSNRPIHGLLSWLLLDAIVIAFVSYSVWQLKLLRNPETERLFVPSSATERPALFRTRFSLKTLLLLFTLSSFIGLRLTDDDLYYSRTHIETSFTTVTEDGQAVKGVVYYGFFVARRNKESRDLKYVVFALQEDSISESKVVVKGTGSDHSISMSANNGEWSKTTVLNSGRSVYLESSDSVSISLFDHPGVYDASGTELTSTALSISLEQLEEFLADDKSAKSIRGLNEFVESTK